MYDTQLKQEGQFLEYKRVGTKNIKEISSKSKGISNGCKNTNQKICKSCIKEMEIIKDKTMLITTLFFI